LSKKLFLEKSPNFPDLSLGQLLFRKEPYFDFSLHQLIDTKGPYFPHVSLGKKRFKNRDFFQARPDIEWGLIFTSRLHW